MGAVRSTVTNTLGRGYLLPCQFVVHRQRKNNSVLARLVRAARSLLPDGDRRFWFIDEISTITDGWPYRIKWLRDNDPRFRGDTVVLTGSSSADLSESVGVLAGRRGGALDADRVLLPLGFRTFVKLTERAESLEKAVPAPRVGDLTHELLRDAAYELVPWLHVLAESWEAYLRVGGFHQHVSAHVGRREQDEAFREELFDVVDRDALRRASWSRTETAAFLRRVVKGLSSHTNQSAIAAHLGVTPPTVKSRIDDLCAAFVLWPCHREKDLRPQVRSQRNRYFTDPAYTGLTTDPAPDLPVLSEQQLGMALLRNLETHDPGGNLDFDKVLHHRSPTKAEIDFVGPDLGEVAIESRYVDHGWRRPARTIRASRWRGIVATRTVLDVDDPDLMEIPTALLAWLLDT